MITFIRFLIRVVASGVAIALVAKILPGITILHQDVTTYLLLGLVIGLVNGILRPIVSFLTLPLTILTLGIFQLVLNALLLLLVGVIIPNLHIDGFWPAFFGGIILSIVGGLLDWALRHVLRVDEASRVAAESHA